MSTGSHFKNRRFILVVLGVALLTLRCGDKFMQSKVTNESKGSFELAATADGAGNYTGAIDPSSSSTQVLRATSGDLAGSAISLPPGALGINLNITIGSGETLASSDTTQQLGLGDNTATAAGPAVSFVPSSNVEATSPFTLSIPVTGTSLALASSDNENLIVMYKWMKVENGVVSYAIGIIPRDTLTVGSKTVQFQTTKFGTFQLAVTATKITEAVNKPTAEPPVLKADVSNPLVGVWSECKANTSRTTTTTTTTTNTVDPAVIQAQLTQELASLIAADAAISLSANCSTPNIQIMLDATAAMVGTALPFEYTAAQTISGTTSPVGSTVTNTLAVGTTNLSTHTFSVSPIPAGNKFFIDIITAGCHFGSNPGVKRLHFSTCSMTSVYVYCDGKTATDLFNETLAAANASLANSPAGTTTTTTTSNSGGDSRDQLGVPANMQTYSREFVKFSAATFIHSRGTFRDAGCTGPLISRVEETGSYTLGALKSNGTYPIAITFATNNGTIFPQAGVDLANGAPTTSGCGYADWVAGTPRDLTGSNCQKSDKGSNGPSIVKIDAGKIYFDDGGSGTLNTKEALTRQP